MNYKLVIFDFDGTLADSFPYFLQTVNILAETYNFPKIDLQDVDRLRGMDARQMMKRAKLPAWKIPLIANSFIRLMARDIDQISLFDGIPALLQQLSDQGVQLAIISSNSEENIRRVLGPENASRITYYGCGTSLFGKQRKFSKLIEKSGFKPSEILSIGDEIRDMEAANEAQMPFGAVAWGYTRPDVFDAFPNIKFFTTVDDIARMILGDKLSTES